MHFQADRWSYEWGFADDGTHREPYVRMALLRAMVAFG